MKRTRSHVIWSLVTGLVLLFSVAEGLKGTALVISKLKGKTESTPPVAENRNSDEENGNSGKTEVAVDPLPLSASGGDAANATTKSNLTGIPQIDYIYDPNLPRELNGYNLTDYPFYDRVPEDINFKCDGLHDGFYASIPHKCQVYHHCLFGTRYDFLCANYTAFDQKTFICHFVSEVDCVNSPKYFKRNEALYKEATTTVATTTTAATPPPAPAPTRRPPGQRPRPYRTRRPPVYDYYNDYEDDAAFYDELPTRSAAAPAPAAAGGRRRSRPRPQRPLEDDSRTHTSQLSGSSVPVVPLEQGDVQPEADTRSRPAASVYERPRVPPKIRPPVPANERDKYDYTTQRPGGADPEDPARPKQAVRPAETEPDYYDYEEDYIPPARSSPPTSPRRKNNDYYSPSAPEDRNVRRPVPSGGGRPSRRNNPSRRHPESTSAYAPLPLEDGDDYDEEYEYKQRRPLRPAGRRKRPQESYRPSQPARAGTEYTQSQRPYVRGQSTRYDDEEDFVEDPVPAPRPAYISTAPGGTTPRQEYPRRVHQQPETDDYLPARSRVADSPGYRRPAATHRKQPPPARQTGYADDEDYYDGEELSEEMPHTPYRPKQQPRNSGGRVQSVNSSPSSSLPLPPPARIAQVEDDGIIEPPDRPSNGKRPFLPSRGGNPTLPRGLQPLGAKAAQPTSKLDSPAVDITEDRSVKVSQPLSATSYRPKSEISEEIPLRQNSAPKSPGAPSLSEALTSRPLLQNFKAGGNRPSQVDSTEEEYSPSKGSSSDYQNKEVEDTQLRIPPSGAGNFKNRQAVPASSISDNIARTPTITGKYKSSVSEILPRNPSLASPGYSSSNYKSKPDEISLATAKTSPPLLNIRDDSNRQVTGSQKTYDINEDYRSLPPSASVKQASAAIYRAPSKSVPKPSVAPPPRIPDLPAKTNLADIDESEYDVTLNDALHPTLHPTRSVATGIASFPQQQTPPYRVQVFKTKVGSPSSSPSLSSSSSRRGAESYSNDASSSLTGGRGQLVASASQRQVTRAPYTSLSVHTKDPIPVVVETSPRDYQTDDSVQLTRKRRPQSQFNDETSPHLTSRYTQADRYQRGTADYDSLPLLVAEDVPYNPERQTQNWRRDPNVEYASHY